MKKILFNHKLQMIIIFIILFVFVLFQYFKSFHFNQDMIWRIDEKRREHLFFLFKESRLIHNKFLFFIDIIIGIYLQYLSPLTLFSQTSSFVINLLLLGLFFNGVTIYLKSKLKMKKILGVWVLIYPAFSALNINYPDKYSIIPITVPFLIVGSFSLVKTLHRK